ncbi:MAG TPA: PDZ domain-containing protein [Vicinamibacterales bacterium]|jgi:predicted metalloprotease with PDZ domain
MRTAIRACVVAAVVFVAAASAGAAVPPDTMTFTVSVPDIAAHQFHVVVRCDGLTGETAEFRMPVWTPGYYGLFDFAGNVRNFAAADGDGKPLTWEKTGPNAWTVRKGRASSLELRYDVLATRPFVANAYVDETRGYILPGAVFVYVPGRLRRPVTVKIELPAAWNAVATGLDRASSDGARTFAAPDFDVLYDSPILMGNLESLPPFEIRGVRHEFVGYRLGDFDRQAFVADLKAVVEAGIDIIGDIPYTHYTFMGIGPGRGGIEHLNSAAVSFAGQPSGDRAARIRELSFLAHEYFHHFNVKRIRPIALGPFDYDRANVTDMLWVSEGFTVYYEYLMLARSGRMTLDELLEVLRKNITAYEDNPGRLFQSATQSSHDTWSQGPFGRKEGRVRKTISYYEKGPILGMLLDFRIRHETQNRSSLDTVMRELYRTYYKELGRGWTDGEFRETCERIAGITLDENFAYASTTREIDYAKYLAYAGLELEQDTERPAAYAGAIVEDRDGRLVAAAVEPHSPAAAGGFRAEDIVVVIDGAAVTADGFDAAVAARKPGDLMKATVERRGERFDLTVTLGHQIDRSFKMKPMAKPAPLQAAILASWTASQATAGTTR